MARCMLRASAQRSSFSLKASLVHHLDHGNGNCGRQRPDRRRGRHRGKELLVERIGHVHDAPRQELEHRRPDRPQVGASVDLSQRARLLVCQAGVPMVEPDRVALLSVESVQPRDAEMSSFTPPVRVRKMLSGLMSR
jgi:hypothetical protein